MAPNPSSSLRRDYTTAIAKRGTQAKARAALKSIEGGDEWDGTFRDGCDETKDHR